MLNTDDKEILRKVCQFVPQLEQLLERKLQEELKDLPHRGLDKVQVCQGRCLALQDLLAELIAAGNPANRTAKPQL